MRVNDYIIQHVPRISGLLICETWWCPDHYVQYRPTFVFLFALQTYLPMPYSMIWFGASKQCGSLTVFTELSLFGDIARPMELCM